MSVLAVDAGTAGVTAVVVSPGGRIVASAGRGLPQHSPRPGWVEHAAEEIWQATTGATREVLDQVDTSDLTGLGITNQRETVVLWDRETLGAPRRAIAGQDRRTGGTCERLRADGHEDRVAELTGLPLDPGFSGTILRWLAEHEPHTWALVESGRYAIGTVDSYLVARMTRGTWHVTDVSNASRTQLLDLGAGDWSDELCEVFGVPRDALPDLVPSWGEVAATEPRAFLGLGLPIAGIAGDQQAALVGQACVEAGDARSTLGADPSIVLNTGATLERPRAGMLSTAAWRSPAGEMTYALEGPVGSPALDRWPRVSRLRVDGAGVADDRQCQALADRTGLPVERPEVVETAVLGAAFLAGLGTGVWESVDALRETWALDRRFEPVSD